MAKKIYQMTHTYKLDKSGKEQTQKTSFGTVEKAIENAEMWINKSEPWIDTTPIQIIIHNKETGDILYHYHK